MGGRCSCNLCLRNDQLPSIKLHFHCFVGHYMVMHSPHGPFCPHRAHANIQINHLISGDIAAAASALKGTRHLAPLQPALSLQRICIDVCSVRRPSMCTWSAPSWMLISGTIPPRAPSNSAFTFCSAGFIQWHPPLAFDLSC